MSDITKFENENCLKKYWRGNKMSNEVVVDLHTWDRMRDKLKELEEFKEKCENKENDFASEIAESLNQATSITHIKQRKTWRHVEV